MVELSHLGSLLHPVIVGTKVSILDIVENGVMEEDTVLRDHSYLLSERNECQNIMINVMLGT